jgi:TetR/AcrR family transcriptional regulator
MTTDKKDNTEQKILNAAQKVFVKKGLDGSRMQEIADEAGINKALLHYYFRTKQKLFEAIFKKLIRKAIPDIKEVFFSELPVEKKIGVFVEVYSDLIAKNPYLPMFILREIYRDPRSLAVVLKNQGIHPAEVLAVFEKEMEKGNIRRLDPRDLLIHLLALTIFPVVASPLMSEVFFNGNKTEYRNFLIQRKTTVKEFILNSISIR